MPTPSGVKVNKFASMKEQPAESGAVSSKLTSYMKHKTMKLKQEQIEKEIYDK